jgi:hypothetical protein
MPPRTPHTDACQSRGTRNIRGILKRARNACGPSAQGFRSQDADTAPDLRGPRRAAQSGDTRKIEQVIDKLGFTGELERR